MTSTDSEFKLNKGGRYLIRLPEEEDTIGFFRGYCTLGEDPALVIEMAEGKIRFVPTAQITFIDVLDAGVSEKQGPKRDDVNYG